MKILLISMTCGEGHNAVVTSLKNAFDKREVESKIIQLYGFKRKKVNLENKRYLGLVNYFPKSYDWLWNKMRHRDTDKKSSFFDASVKNCEEYFLKEINEFMPDAIICAHCYAGNVLSKIIEKGLIKDIKTYSVLTDFCVHPFWEFSKNIGCVFTPLENTTQDLLKRGFVESQIFPFGFPVNEKFNKKINKAELLEKFMIANKPTVLISSGGYGIGNPIKIIKSIKMFNENVRIIVANGKNEKNFYLVEKFMQKNKDLDIINLTFVDNFNEYLAISDIIISKAGCGTLSEAIKMEVPIIIKAKAIINEKINSEFLAKAGIAIELKKNFEVGMEVRKLLKDKIKYNTMKSNFGKFTDKNSIELIIEKIEKDLANK